MPYTYDITTYPGLDDQICASKPTKKERKKAKLKKNNNSEDNRLIRFYQKVAVYEHIHHKEMKPSEHSQYWFQEQECAQNEADVIQTVARMEKTMRTRRFSNGSNSADIDDDTFCSRGLEGRTRTGSKNVCKTRTEARNVVQNEQHRQWSDISRTSLNVESLARVYRTKTEPAAIAARRAGIRDEEYVMELYFPGMNTTSTSTKKSMIFFNFPRRASTGSTVSGMLSRQNARN